MHLQTIMVINSQNLKNIIKMNIKIKHKLLGIIVVLTVMACFTGCKDGVDLELPYLFRPINLNVEMNKTVATISWAPVEDAVSYTLQLSTDSVDYDANIVVDTTLTDLSFVKELGGETYYYVRLYANAEDSGKNSKYNQLTFRTPAENIFTGYGTNINTGKVYSAYMTDVHTLTVKWTPGANVTHLIMTSADESTRDSLLISSSEAAAGVKVIGSLANSNWYIKIYNNKIQRGKTYGLVEGDIVLQSGDDLLSAMTSAVSGNVILLAGGATFPIGGSAFNFSQNIKIRSASVTDKSVVCMTAGTPTTTSNMFGIAASSVIDSLIFENIDFTGYCDNSSTQTKIGYLFSNKVMCNVTDVKFKNCVIRNFGNTPMRVSGGSNQVIENLVFNGCIINDIGYSSTYAIVNSNSADLINNITFSNSTIYNFKGSLVLRTGQTLTSVNVTNCTINQATQDPGSARYMFDLKDAVFSTNKGLTIRNTIFGSSGGALGANGIRYVSGTAISISGSYFTADYVDDPIPAGATSTSIKSLLTSYSGNSTNLWNDPAKGDFSLIDPAFAGKGLAGDLRWY